MDFNFIVESGGLFKVTGSYHVHYKCASISKTMQDTDVVTTNY